MSLADLTPSAQNYLKVIWAGSEWSDAPISPSMIADRLGLRLSTVSEGVRKLANQGLVNHTPYGAVQLTEEGRMYALTMIRRHRLIETFLVNTLGYTWDEVHDEADLLEHAVSDLMIERIDEHLEFPDRDPHGDPIPKADGTVLMPAAAQLSLVPLPADVTVERIADDDPELLQHFESVGLTVGGKYRIVEGLPFSGTIRMQPTDGEEFLLGKTATDALYVSHAGTTTSP